MPRRYDAQVFFDETLDVTACDQSIKKLRKDGHRVLFLHVVMAAIVRTMSDYPKLNRFVAGKKVYARNHIAISFAMKKSLSLDANETVVKVLFHQEDTLFDVIEKVNTVIKENQVESHANKTDKFALFLKLLPSVLIRFVVFMAKVLDNHRFLPKWIIKLSPFHSSAFVTDLGSLGINPAFHHIYDFGTTSQFLAFGTKRKAENDHTKKLMTIKVVIDERIVDGYYYARGLKRLSRYIKDPNILITPPEKSQVDNEI